MISVIFMISLVCVVLWMAGLPAWEAFKIFSTYAAIVLFGWILWVAFLYFGFIRPFIQWIAS